MNLDLKLKFKNLKVFKFHIFNYIIILETFKFQIRQITSFFLKKCFGQRSSYTENFKRRDNICFFIKVITFPSNPINNITIPNFTSYWTY